MPPAGQEEGALAFAGASSCLPAGQACLLIDLGGRSTEFCFGEGAFGKHASPIHPIYTPPFAWYSVVSFAAHCATHSAACSKAQHTAQHSIAHSYGHWCTGALSCLPLPPKPQNPAGLAGASQPEWVASVPLGCLGAQRAARDVEGWLLAAEQVGRVTRLIWGGWVPGGVGGWLGGWGWG